MTETARTQKNRTLAIETPLGPDKLLLVAMHGSEALGRLFEYELDLATEGTPVDFTKILGQNVTIRLALRDGGTRFFNGYISKFTFVALDESQKDHRKVYQYRATMVPWTWFMTRSADCRIFQELKVPEIIEKIFREKGFTDFSNETSGTYRKWEYCVQYRETDFNFISRLMENEGIYYYFKQENGKHTLVMCDAPSNHSPAAGCDNLHFDEPDLRSTHDAYIWDWVLGHEITPNQYALDDFDPLQPRTELFKSLNIEHAHDPGTYEIYDYPGGYVTGGEGGTYTHVRLEELIAQYAVAHGISSARSLFAGATFTLQDHPAFDAEEYLVTAIAYQLQNDDLGLGASRSSERGAYQCQVTCIPTGNGYRTPRTTPKPVVQGPQTAIIVGPSGEEIYTDKYGRVKVYFHWDRDAKADEKSSCWVRVSQGVAGKKWGEVSIPRIGQEVIVDFLEGDPDRPIITGRVYNGENMPPYELPDNKTRTGFKSNSSKGGAGFNELRFEDKKGDEQIYIQAEKDMDVRVKHDRNETVVNDDHTVVQNDLYRSVTGHVHDTIGGNSYEDIAGEHHENIGGQEAKEIGGAMSLTVGGNANESIGGDHSETTGGKHSIVAATLVISADKITLKAGGNSITMGSGGISIKADGDVKIDSSGATKITAGSEINGQAKKISFTAAATMSLKADGAITVEASGKLTLKAGGIVETKGSLIKLN